MPPEYIQDETPSKSFVQEIASLLGSDWTVGSSYGHHTLEKSSIGLVLNICDSRDKKGMLSIRHQIPRVDSQGNLNKTAAQIYLYKKGGTGTETFPSILVSNKKSASQVFKDIQRRMLEEAERVQILANEEMQRLKISSNKQETAIERMRLALGVKDLRESLRSNGSYSNGYCTATVNGGGNSVEFSICSLPIEKAEKLAEYLKLEIFS